MEVSETFYQSCKVVQFSITHKKGKRCEILKLTFQEEINSMPIISTATMQVYN